MPDILLLEIPRHGRNSTIRLRVREIQGKKRVDIRDFFQLENGEWQPTRRGVVIHKEEIPLFIEKFEEADKLIEA